MLLVSQLSDEGEYNMNAKRIAAGTIAGVMLASTCPKCAKGDDGI